MSRFLPGRRLKWPALRVRTLLLLILLLGGALGSWAESTRRQRRATEAILAIDPKATIAYQGEFFEDSCTYIFCVFGRTEDEGRSWLRDRLEPWLGKDATRPVESVSFGFFLRDPSPEQRREFFRALSTFRGLKHLVFFPPASGDEVASLARFRHLESLRLPTPSPRLTDSAFLPFRDHPSLRNLEIGSAPLTDASLEIFGSLRRLESLDLGYIDPDSFEESAWPSLLSLTGEGLVHLDRLPALANLTIRSDRLTGAGLGHIGRLESLTGLGLGGGVYSGDDLAPLGSLRRLESLFLTVTPALGPGLSHLSSLPALSSVILQGPAIDDEVITPLSRFPALADLCLDETSVTFPGLVPLTASPNLQMLDVYPPPPGDHLPLKSSNPRFFVNINHDAFY